MSETTILVKNGDSMREASLFFFVEEHGDNNMHIVADGINCDLSVGGAALAAFQDGYPLFRAIQTLFIAYIHAKRR